VVICLERSAHLHIAQLMPLPLTVSCFSKIQIGFTFLVPAHLGSPGKRTVKRLCVCVVNIRCSEISNVLFDRFLSLLSIALRNDVCAAHEFSVNFLNSFREFSVKLGIFSETSREITNFSL